MLATCEDLLKVPDQLIAEIVNGELHTSPRPPGRAARASGTILRRLGIAFDHDERGPEGWWIAYAPEIHLGTDVLVPDVAGWKRNRVPDYLRGDFWEVPPDWICEVLSPQTARFDRS